MKNNTKQTLEYIIEKANELRDFEFEKHVEKTGLGFQIMKQDDGSSIINFGTPDIKELNSFLVTFRMFYNETDMISIPKLLKIFNDPSLSKEYKDQVVGLRKDFFDYINSYSAYTVNYFEGHPTRKQMIDVGFNSGKFHLNRQKMIDQYKKWTRININVPIFWQEFTRFIIYILGIIYLLAEFCQEELNRHPA